MNNKLEKQIRTQVHHGVDVIYYILWDRISSEVIVNIARGVSDEFWKIRDPVKYQVRDCVYDQTRDYIIN